MVDFGRHGSSDRNDDTAGHQRNVDWEVLLVVDPVAVLPLNLPQKKFSLK